ncbi:hypothetical protein CP533_5289 [Ophiocordyceps camponoti-saundersi (nom. inval.)]|nr:hypothetical protein CP533_5289 [Ophiocordyceps camponoti-saundersi (nom. inval.)]
MALTNLATLLLLTSNVAAQTFTLLQTINGSNFYDEFEFLTKGRNPNKTYDDNDAFVRYQPLASAQQKNLTRIEDDGQIYLGVDHTTVLGPDTDHGRDAFRIQTRRAYNQGLFIMRFSHMPKPVCGAWPAYWTVGDGEWPLNGEIDLYEGWNLNTANRPSFHAGTPSQVGNCTLESELVRSDIISNNCDNSFEKRPSQPVGQGCQVNETEDGIWGSPEGGIQVLQWTKEEVKVYTWPYNLAPPNLENNEIDTSAWGKPSIHLRKPSCNVESALRNLRFILNIAFCGGLQWGEGPGGPSCQAKTKQTCEDYVGSHPEDFRDVFFRVKDFRYYALPLLDDEEQTVVKRQVEEQGENSITLDGEEKPRRRCKSKNRKKVQEQEEKETTQAGDDDDAANSVDTSGGDSMIQKGNSSAGDDSVVSGHDAAGSSATGSSVTGSFAHQNTEHPSEASASRSTANSSDVSPTTHSTIVSDSNQKNGSSSLEASPSNTSDTSIPHQLHDQPSNITEGVLSRKGRSSGDDGVDSEQPSEEPASEKSASEKSASEKSASKKSASETSASENSASEESASEKSASEKPASESTATTSESSSVVPPVPDHTDPSTSPSEAETATTNPNPPQLSATHHSNTTHLNITELILSRKGRSSGDNPLEQQLPEESTSESSTAPTSSSSSPETETTDLPATEETDASTSPEVELATTNTSAPQLSSTQHSKTTHLNMTEGLSRKGRSSGDESETETGASLFGHFSNGTLPIISRKGRSSGDNSDESASADALSLEENHAEQSQISSSGSSGEESVDGNPESGSQAGYDSVNLDGSDLTPSSSSSPQITTINTDAKVAAKWQLELAEKAVQDGVQPKEEPVELTSTTTLTTTTCPSPAVCQGKSSFLPVAYTTQLAATPITTQPEATSTAYRGRLKVVLKIRVVVKLMRCKANMPGCPDKGAVVVTTTVTETCPATPTPTPITSAGIANEQKPSKSPPTEETPRLSDSGGGTSNGYGPQGSPPTEETPRLDDGSGGTSNGYGPDGLPPTQVGNPAPDAGQRRKLSSWTSINVVKTVTLSRCPPSVTNCAIGKVTTTTVEPKTRCSSPGCGPATAEEPRMTSMTIPAPRPTTSSASSSGHSGVAETPSCTGTECDALPTGMRPPPAQRPKEPSPKAEPVPPPQSPPTKPAQNRNKTRPPPPPGVLVKEPEVVKTPDEPERKGSSVNQQQPRPMDEQVPEEAVSDEKGDRLPPVPERPRPLNRKTRETAPVEPELERPTAPEKPIIDLLPDLPPVPQELRHDEEPPAERPQAGKSTSKEEPEPRPYEGPRRPQIHKTPLRGAEPGKPVPGKPVPDKPVREQVAETPASSPRVHGQPPAKGAPALKDTQPASRPGQGSKPAQPPSPPAAGCVGKACDVPPVFAGASRTKAGALAAAVAVAATVMMV